MNPQFWCCHSTTSAPRPASGMAQAFTTEIIVNLTQSRSLAVFGTEPVIDAEQSPTISVDYRFSGSVAQSSNVVMAIALLSDANTGQVVWSWRAQRQVDASGPMAAQSAMAKDAAAALLVHLRANRSRNSGRSGRRGCGQGTSGHSQLIRGCRQHIHKLLANPARALQMAFMSNLAGSAIAPRSLGSGEARSGAMFRNFTRSATFFTSSFAMARAR